MSANVTVYLFHQEQTAAFLEMCRRLKERGLRPSAALHVRLCVEDAARLKELQRAEPDVFGDC